jgi:hypothetical protein
MNVYNVLMWNDRKVQVCADSEEAAERMAEEIYGMIAIIAESV